VNEAFLPNLKNAFILNAVAGSDHCPLGIEIDVDDQDQILN
jgi:exodeoxyribonuclease-3